MLTENQVLDRYFLEARAWLIQLGAFLDRHERAGGGRDPRLDQLQDALGVLQSQGVDNRAEQIQMIFSDPLTADRSLSSPCT